MPEQTGKSKALRVRLDYYKRGGWLYRSRWLAAAAGFVLAGGYGLLVLAGAWRTDDDSSPVWLRKTALHVSTGPVSRAHAHFEEQCQQCHSAKLLQSIASDAFQWDRAANVEHISTACRKCHDVTSHVGPTATLVCRQIDQHCSNCHQEHQGRAANLSAVTADACVQCHADLSAFTNRSVDLSANIDRFSVESHSADGTQQFRSLLSDPGRIKFDHAQHLNPGQVDIGNRGGFQQAMLPDRWSDKYTSNANGLVQLVCSDCHRLQAPSGSNRSGSGSDSSTATDAELAHYYAPIDYEQHCVACHQLTFVGQQQDSLPLPHAAPRAEVEQLLSAKLRGGRVRGNIRTRGSDELGNSPAELPDDVVNVDDDELQMAVEKVYSRCAKCHQAEDVTDPNIKARLRGDLESPLIPDRWLARGLFDHGAHRAITNCQFCHPVPSQIERAEKGAAADHTTVMIRGPESCVPCHRDPNAASTLAGLPESELEGLLGQVPQPTLASDNCMLCHRYHWSRSPNSVATTTGAEP